MACCPFLLCVACCWGCARVLTSSHLLGHAACAGKRRGRRHFNPWTPEVQQQLATVLRSVLASPTVPGPPETDVAALPPRLAKLAADLSASAAVEQLQGMSVALPNAVGLLQVRCALSVAVAALPPCLPAG